MLAEKAMDGNATAAELDQLISCLQKPAAQEVLNDLIAVRGASGEALALSELDLTGNTLQDYQDAPEKYASVIEEVLLADRIPAEPDKLSRNAVKSKRFYWYRAAVILLVGGIGLLVALSVQKSRQSAIRKVGSIDQTCQQIRPGKDKAILTLADGRQILLDSAGNGVLADQNGVDVHKVQNGQLIYTENQAGESGQAAGTGQMVYNSIETPKGGKYQLVLPDGTKVWLNAGSRLKFPTRFTGDRRIVSMQGEAYFEVAKDARHPFIVQTSRGMDVRVLGTHFNISDYPDQAAVKTTLLEGSVRVVHNRDSLMIVPGQQALMSADGTLTKKADIDLDQVIAWKDGLFYFDQMHIESIMQALSRWYDIEVVYVGDHPADLFSAIMNRGNDIYEILSMLEATEKVHFKISGRTIQVMAAGGS